MLPIVVFVRAGDGASPEEGCGGRRHSTADDRPADAAIAEVWNLYDSKIAEQDILQQSAMKRPLTADPAELEEAGRQFRRERLASERDAKVEKIRRS